MTTRKTHSMDMTRAMIDAENFAERVEALREEAHDRGDNKMVVICHLALGGPVPDSVSDALTDEERDDLGDMGFADAEIAAADALLDAHDAWCSCSSPESIDHE